MISFIAVWILYELLVQWCVSWNGSKVLTNLFHPEFFALSKKMVLINFMCENNKICVINAKKVKKFVIQSIHTYWTKIAKNVHCLDYPMCHDPIDLLKPSIFNANKNCSKNVNFFLSGLGWLNVWTRLHLLVWFNMGSKSNWLDRHRMLHGWHNRVYWAVKEMVNGLVSW